ncbi:MAG: HD domain-containing phosphohydrolase [Syntrophomonas sp.]
MVLKNHRSLLNYIQGRGRTRLMFWSLLVMAVLGASYIYHAWVIVNREAQAQALNIAWTAKASLQERAIFKLQAVPQDVNKPQYQHIKSSLTKLVEVSQNIRNAYLYTEKNGKLYFLVDSEQPEAKNYSPPGQIYKEAAPAYRLPFSGGQAVVSGMVQDRWGKWISILIPVKDPGTGKVKAVFGIDYDATQWYKGILFHTLEAAMIVFALFLLLLVFYGLLIRNQTLAEERRKLRLANQEIEKSEEKFAKAFHSGAVLMAIAEIEDGVADRILDINTAFLDTLACTREEVIGKNIANMDLFVDDSQRMAMISQMANAGRISGFEALVKGKDGAMHTGIFTLDNIEIGETHCCLISMTDISKRKEDEERVKYLSFHDSLTGAYNRAFFEEELKRLDTDRNLPISIIMADLNGLKLVNDTFGHQTGDQLLKTSAQILQKLTRQEDIVARIGGDEFVILLPRTTEKQAQDMVDRIVQECGGTELNGIKVSISLGVACKEDPSTDINKIRSLSDERMYSKKLLEDKSNRKYMIASLLKILNEKTYETEEHCFRLAALGSRLGEKMGLSDEQLERLKVLSVMHDIGKIAVPEDILAKPGELSDEEYAEISRHSENGYRIVNMTPEFGHISEEILSHHERWDGTGYPRGLKGTEIPVVARILSVVDALDVMTNDQVYRKAMSPEAAKAELIRHAGTQFDPEIVKVLITEVWEENF